MRTEKETMSISAVSSLYRVLSPAASSAAAKPMTPRQKELRQAADEVVGSVFFGEMFKAMRSSRLKGEFGHGGRGEEVFSAQLHEVLAKRMSHGGKFGLNDALYKRFAANV